MSTQTLPNQSNTWRTLSNCVDEFPAWQKRVGLRFASVEAELMAYLTDQLHDEGADLVGARFVHPVLGLLSHMAREGSRIQELTYAYLAIAVAQDCSPALRLIAGQRLQVGLHPDYIAQTQSGEAPAPRQT